MNIILTNYGIDANLGLVHGIDAHGRCVFAAIPSTLGQVQVSKGWVRFESKNRELVQLNGAGWDVAKRIMEVAQDLRLAEYKRAWQLIYPGNKMSVEDWGRIGKQLIERVNSEIKAKAAQPEAELVTVTPVYFYNAIVLKQGRANRILRRFNGTYIPDDGMPIHGMVAHIQEQVLAKLKADGWIDTEVVVHVNQLNRLN